MPPYLRHVAWSRRLRIGGIDQHGNAGRAVVPGAKVKFDAPAGTGIALSNRDSRADLGRAKRYLGYEPQFKLQDAVKDLGDWMRRYLA